MYDTTDLVPAGTTVNQVLLQIAGTKARGGIEAWDSVFRVEINQMVREGTPVVFDLLTRCQQEPVGNVVAGTLTCLRDLARGNEGWGVNQITYGNVVMGLLYFTEQPFPQLRFRLFGFTRAAPDELEARKRARGVTVAQGTPAGSTQANAPSTETRGMRDLIVEAKARRPEPVFGRATDLRKMVQCMMGALRNNVVITGLSGVGTTSMLRAFVLAHIDGELPEALLARPVWLLDLDEVMSGGDVRPGALDQRIFPLIQKAQAQGAVVQIDDLRRVLRGPSTPDGATGLATHVRRLLEDPNVPVLATCEEGAWIRSISEVSGFARHFVQVALEPPSPADAKGVLRAMAPMLEKAHGLPIDNSAISAAVDLGRRFYSREADPARSLALLDAACAVVSTSQDQVPAELLAIQSRRLVLEGEKVRLLEEVDERSAMRAEEVEKEINTLGETFARRSAEVEAARARGKKIEELRRKLHATRKARGAGYVQMSQEYEALLKERQEAAGNVRVDADAVASVVAERMGIPSSRLRLSEAERLLHMEDEMREMVVGQDPALNAIGNAIRRSRAGLQKPRRPIGSFVFAGPTGVGKTETARALARFLFGDPEAVVRLDMSEFKEAHSLARLTGSAPGLVGYSEGGTLTNAVMQRPASVVLLDEVEKAHKDSTDLFLQVLDAGRLTDGKGNTADFRNTVVLFTTNLGGLDGVRAHFKPEFINRLDDVIEFQPLGHDQLLRVARMHVDEVVKSVWEAHGIHVVAGEDVLDALVTWTHDPRYGARPIHRGVLRLLGDPLSVRLLSDPPGPGHILTVTVDVEARRLLLSD